MGNRGRGSNKIKALDTPNIKRPLPLKGMTAPARLVWKRIASSLPADYFKPHQYDLLRMFCEDATINKFAHAKSVSEEYANPYWINLSTKMAASCTALSTKLGITVNSTMAARGKGGAAPKAKSKFGDLISGGVE